jgi:hypothetical protein
MLQKLIFFISLLFIGNASAGKVYMALIPTNNQLHVIATYMEQPCTPAEGNFLYMVEKRASMGCWKRDGNQIKVEWFKGDPAPTNTFDFNIFKLIADDGIQSTDEARKKGVKVLLNCTSQGWVGDIQIERDEVGALKKLVVSGQDVSFEENVTSINFSFKGKNVSLSTTTGIFSYETSGFQSYLNNRLLGGGNVKGTGSCNLADATKKF